VEELVQFLILSVIVYHYDCMLHPVRPEGRLKTTSDKGNN